MESNRIIELQNNNECTHAQIKLHPQKYFHIGWYPFTIMDTCQKRHSVFSNTVF